MRPPSFNKVREGLETLYKEGFQEGLAGVEPDLKSKTPCPALRRARFLQSYNSFTLLEQWQRVADDQAVFVLIALARISLRHMAFFQATPTFFSGPCWHDVGNSDVTFPLARAVGVCLDLSNTHSATGIDIVATQVNHTSGQARYANLGEVIRVASLPGTFASTGKLGNLRVSGQISRRTIALVQEREVTVAVAGLVTATEGVTFNGVQKQAAVQVVVDFTFDDISAGGVSTVVTAGEVVGVVAVCYRQSGY